MAMRSFFSASVLMILSCLSVHGVVYYYEGVETYKNAGQINWSFIERLKLLPVDPIIVHVGAYDGKDTCCAVRSWPEARIFALDANPRVCVEMLKHIAEADVSNIKMQYVAIGDHNGVAPFFLSRGPNGNDISYEDASSLLPLTPDLAMSNGESKIEVRCMILDDWCRLNNIEHIDILRDC